MKNNMKKSFTIRIELPMPRSEVKRRMDLTTTHTVFGSKKDYQRKPKHRKPYGGDE